MSIEKILKILELTPRLLATFVLCVFAYVPVFILFHLIPQLFIEPSSLTWQLLLIISFCCMLLYFLLLIAYRAFTGKGRKEDGGLLPPIVMKTFIAAFGVIAMLIIIFGIYKGEIIPIVGGIGYLLTALTASKIIKSRQYNNDRY